MQLLTDCYRYRLQPIFKSFNLTDTDTDVYIWITCRYQFCQKYRPSDTDNWSIAKCNFQKNSLVLIKYLKYTWLEHRQTLKSWLWKRLKLHDWLCESTAPSFVFNLTTIGAFFALFWPFGAIFAAGVKFKNFFGTYLSTQSTLVLGVQPHFFVFNSAIFWDSFALFWVLGGYLFGHLGLFLGLRSSSKTFLEPTHVDYQLWFWK